MCQCLHSVVAGPRAPTAIYSRIKEVNSAYLLLFPQEVVKSAYLPLFTQEVNNAYLPLFTTLLHNAQASVLKESWAFCLEKRVGKSLGIQLNAGKEVSSNIVLHLSKNQATSLNLLKGRSVNPLP